MTRETRTAKLYNDELDIWGQTHKGVDRPIQAQAEEITWKTHTVHPMPVTICLIVLAAFAYYIYSFWEYFDPSDVTSARALFFFLLLWAPHILILLPIIGYGFAPYQRREHPR